MIFIPPECQDIQCFSEAIQKCKPVSWLREDNSASWLYIIEGERDNKCEVRVKLKQINLGTIDSEKLQGEEMICFVSKGSTRFPEKDLGSCHGYLREDIQDLIIQRMHNYLLENVGEIEKGFNEF
jgi:hypothetical protein